jgi:hypothetical protein
MDISVELLVLIFLKTQTFLLYAYDDSFGGVFHPQSLGLALKEDFKVETQRDACLRATEIVSQH